MATLGFCNTGVAQKSLEIFQNAKLPLIIPCATGSPLTAKYPAPESYICRTSPRDAIQAPYVVDDIVRRGWSRVAIFADATGYGDAGLKDVEAALGVENAVIANGGKELKWKVPQVGAWPLSFPFFINGAKAAAEGAMMAQSFIAEPSNERPFSINDKDAITRNMVFMVKVSNGVVTFARSEDARQSAVVKRKN